MSVARRIYWVDQDRFDAKPDRSTWIETSKVLSDCGYKVEILTWGPSGYQPESSDVRIRYFAAIDALWLFRYSLLLNILFWLVRNSSQDDLIIVHPDGLLITPLLRLFGRKNIHLDVRTVPVEVNSFKRKLDRWLFWKLPMAYLVKMARSYSFITVRLKNLVEEEFRIEFDDYAVWSSGVNTNRFTPKEPSSAESSELILFYHGTISDDRGLGRVILAMSEIKADFQRRIRFVLVGDGPDLQSLKSLTSELALSDVVSFEGKHPYESIPDLVATADVCICPLPDRPEWNVSSPIKVFEYMASGKPMILTPIPAHLDIGESRKFIVWTKGDEPEHYSHAIAHAFHNIGALRAAAHEAPEIARRHFEWTVQGRRLASYLDRKFVVGSDSGHVPDSRR